MLTLLLGPDDFSKKSYITSLAQKIKAEVQSFVDSENLPSVENLTSQDLFSQPRVFVLRNLTSQYNQPEIIAALLASKNQIIFLEEKLDRRSSLNKQLLANKNITVKQFELPHGRELNTWLEDRIKFYRGKISTAGVEALAIALGRDDAKETKIAGKIIDTREIYNLWQADSEVQKLIAFAAGKEITPENVKALCIENGEVDVFDLTNAIAEREKLKALELLHGFLGAQTGSDEKGAVIQLNALLSEQFRNVAAVQDFLATKKSEDQILEATGWKSGRLFIMKKIASKFPAKKVLEFLTKLEHLDEELKTSSTPPKVLLDLIVSQLLI